VLVSMMQVRDMSMIMLQRQMPMPMGVGPHDFLFVWVLMMGIDVVVGMIVLHARMDVEVVMMFAEENPNPYGHRPLARYSATLQCSPRIGTAAPKPFGLCNTPFSFS